MARKSRYGQMSLGADTCINKILRQPSAQSKHSVHALSDSSRLCCSGQYFYHATTNQHSACFRLTISLPESLHIITDKDCF